MKVVSDFNVQIIYSNFLMYQMFVVSRRLYGGQKSDFCKPLLQLLNYNSNFGDIDIISFHSKK